MPQHIVVTAGPPVYGGRTLARIPQGPAEGPAAGEAGRGAAAPRAKVVLVEGAIPGETVEVSIDREKKDYYLATVQKVIEPSPDRIEPRQCTGCQLHYITYDRQVSIKQEVLADTLRRVGGIEIALSPPLVLPDNAWNYRYRGQFKVSEGKIGFYREGTHEIVDTGYSPLMVDGINEALKRVRGAMGRAPHAFKPVTEIYIAYGDGAYANISIHPKAKGERLRWDELAVLFLDLGFSGLAINIRSGKPLSYGKEFITLPLGDIDYTVSPGAFFQANWKLNQVLVAFIKERLTPLKGKRIVDLYAGAGNFSLPLAREAQEVVAVEENAAAAADGTRNVRMNRITNMRFSRSATEAYNIGNYGPFHVAILDPPRAGLSERLVANLLKASPERIVYVSCNPSTLARDIKRLIPSYEVESVRLVDLFPQTYHIETLAFLARA